MLLINANNINIIKSNYAIKDVLGLYENAQLDLPEETIQEMLRTGELTRENMLRCWTQVNPEVVERIGIEFMPRGELWAIAKNPRLARLILKHRTVISALGDQAVSRAFDNLTIKEADDYNVKLYEVLDNPTVSVEVKRHIIYKGFQTNELPIRNVKELRRYMSVDISPELVRQLEQINYPERLVDPELLTTPFLSKFKDLSSRLLLALCGSYDEILTDTMVETNLAKLSAIEYCSWFKGPATVGQTAKLLSTHGAKPAALKYAAAKGHFDSNTLDEIISLIIKYGDSADMLALYENPHMTNAQKEILRPHVTPSIPLASLRRRMFDSYIVDANERELEDFCHSWQSDPTLMYMVSSPAAFKRAGLYVMQRIDPDAISPHDVVNKCSDEEFTEREADTLMSRILDEGDGELIARFLLMSGIPTKSKQKLTQYIEEDNKAA